MTPGNSVFFIFKGLQSNGLEKILGYLELGACMHGRIMRHGRHAGKGFEGFWGIWRIWVKDFGSKAGRGIVV